MEKDKTYYRIVKISTKGLMALPSIVEWLERLIVKAEYKAEKVSTGIIKVGDATIPADALVLAPLKALQWDLVKGKKRYICPLDCIEEGERIINGLGV